VNDLSFHPVAAGALDRFQRLSLLGGIATVAGVAWLLLLPGLSPLTHTHAGSPGLAAFVVSTAAWFIMMVAMMLPPVVPWLLLVASGARRGSLWSSTAGLFAAGYFAIWLGYSIAAATVQVGLQQVGLLGQDLSLGPRIGGAVLITAGLFQLSPLKDACLTHCRNPIGYFLQRWRDGPVGALRMGAAHGVFCVACCWALMAVAFAVGIMNLLWMAALTAMLILEKNAPGGRLLGVLFGVLLMGWGALRLLA
jgi:predicted metal-binding membrane protein